MTQKELDAINCFANYNADETPNGTGNIDGDDFIRLKVQAAKSIPRSIKTAPKDGTVILIMDGFGDWYQGYWCKEENNCVRTCCHVFTHGKPWAWIPIPECDINSMERPVA